MFWVSFSYVYNNNIKHLWSFKITLKLREEVMVVLLILTSFSNLFKTLEWKSVS